MDKEVLRDIWHGQLPLCFKLNPDDVSGMHRPEPYYMMVSRVTYFPLVLDRVVKYFNRFMDQNKQVLNDMWLDYEGQPIKWQHPIGLSWDLFGSTYDLPWRLILHFSDFPSKELVRCNTKAAIETNFMSSIKEADALKHKGAVIKNMVKKDHSLLWSSLMNDKFEQFWSINKRLMEKTDNELFRCIPFKLYFPDYTYIQKAIKPCTTERHIFRLDVEVWEKQQQQDSDATTSSTPIPSAYEMDIMLNKTHKCHHMSKVVDDASRTKNLEHRCTTTLDLIQISFTNRMDDLLVSSSVALPFSTTRSPSTTSSSLEEGEEEKEKEHPNKDKDNEKRSERKLIDVKLFRYRFMSHGIEIPLDTPLQWLSEHFSYPDNFLHICAVVKDNLDQHHHNL